MVTIEDVAKKAGVGVGTASRAINGGKNVSEKARQQVIKAVKELNYTPNKAARALARKTYNSTTIGIVVPVIIHPFYMEILKGIYQYLRSADYNLLVFNLGNDDEKLYQHIASEMLSGVIVMARGLTENQKNIFKISSTEFVYADYYEEDVSSFYIDNTEGGVLSALHMIRSGITKIGYIGDKSECLQQRERLAGIKKVLSENNLSLIFEELIDFDEDAAYMKTLEMVKKYEVEGILYFCDNLAYGGLSAVKELSLNIKIIGYDDLTASKYLNLTTIRQPAEKIGEEACRYLIEASQSDKTNLKHYSIKPEIIVRN